MKSLTVLIEYNDLDVLWTHFYLVYCYCGTTNETYFIRSKSLSWYINTIIEFLDVIHCPVYYYYYYYCYLKQRFGHWILLSSGKNLLSWAQLSRLLSEDDNKIQCLKWCILNKRKTMMNVVLKLNNCIPSGLSYCKKLNELINIIASIYIPLLGS
jgi:hypothetical protein